MTEVGTVPEGRKPLLDVILEELEARGFYRFDDRDDPEDDWYDLYTYWTHDDWKEWWKNPNTGELSARKHDLKEVIAQIIGEESGYEALTRQPKKVSE